MKRSSALLLALVFFLIAVGCDKASTSDDTTGAADMSGVFTSVDDGLALVGTGLSASASRRAVDDVCDEHAQVKSSVATSTDPEYPALVHYCLIAKDTGSPDSAPGSYSLIKSVVCALQAADGLSFDGQQHVQTLNLTTDCFTESAIEETGSTIVVSVTGSTNPTFAPYYSHGVELSITGADMTFKFATKVTGTLSEFMAVEGGDGESAYAGAYDSSEKKLWYEARMDRFDDTCRGRDCGWSRHIRIYADLEGSRDDINLQAYSGIYTDVYKSGFMGTAATAHGNSTDGLYVRQYNNAGGTRSQLADPTDAVWVLANSSGACNNLGGSGTCSGNTGINMKSAASNGNFFLIPTNSTYASAATWAEALEGMTFTTATFADSQR